MLVITRHGTQLELGGVHSPNSGSYLDFLDLEISQEELHFTWYLEYEMCA